MSTKKLLKGVEKIQDELARHGPNERVEAAIAHLRGIVKIYKAQLAYEKTKAEYSGVRVKLFKPFTAVSGKDRKNLNEAVVVNRQIGRRLREIKMAKVFK
jgi:hypothetical protein